MYLTSPKKKRGSNSFRLGNTTILIPLYYFHNIFTFSSVQINMLFNNFQNSWEARHEFGMAQLQTKRQCNTIALTTYFLELIKKASVVSINLSQFNFHSSKNQLFSQNYDIRLYMTEINKSIYHQIKQIQEILLNFWQVKIFHFYCHIYLTYIKCRGKPSGYKLCIQ